MFSNIADYQKLKSNSLKRKEKNEENSTSNSKNLLEKGRIFKFYHKYLLNDVIDTFLALSLAVVITQVVTNLGKVAVGRPRPDFFNRCFPEIDLTDPMQIEDQLNEKTTYQVPIDCSAGENFFVNHTFYDYSEEDYKKLIKSGRRSFPSGHTSNAFTVGTFMALFIWGKTRTFTKFGNKQGWKLFLGITPLLLAAFVGISRLQDNRHHVEDVFAGAIIGVISTYYAYKVYFPSLDNVCCYSSFRQIEWLIENDKEGQLANWRLQNEMRLLRGESIKNSNRVENSQI